jgi:hypothetical protein
VTGDESTVRDNPPPLDWQPPLCSVCQNETVHLGYTPVAGVNTWACGACRIKWHVENGDDAPGEWMDPDEPQCRSEARTKGTLRSLDLGVARCVLGETHVDAEDWQACEHKGVSTTGRRLEWGRNTWVEEVTPAAPKAERDARTAKRWCRLRAEAKKRGVT